MKKEEQKHQSGGHDDEMMGLAIAHEGRKQVTFEPEIISVKERNQFNFTEELQEDYGEIIEVVQK